MGPNAIVAGVVGAWPRLTLPARVAIGVLAGVAHQEIVDALGLASEAPPAPGRPAWLDGAPGPAAGAGERSAPRK